MSVDTSNRTDVERVRNLLPLAAVLVVGAALRFHGLTTESLWFDELFSVTVATGLTTPEILFELPLSESHPPLYFAVLRWWTLVVGSSEFALRSLSALLGVATLGLLYAVVRDLFDSRVALVATLVLALSPFHVEFSQEVRMYSLFSALTLVSYYLLVKLRDGGGDEYAYGYAVVTALLAYTHVFGLLVVLAQNAYVVASHLLPANERAIDLRRWVRAQVVTGVLVSPWLAVLLYRVLDLTGSSPSPLSWIPRPGPVSLFSTPVRYVTPLWYLVGDDRGPLFPLVGLLLLVVAGLVALALYRSLVAEVDRPAEYYRSLLGWSSEAGETRSTPPSVDRALLLSGWLVVPVLIPFVVSYLLIPVFIHRYTIPASLPLYALVASGVRSVGRNPLRYAVVGVLVVGLAAPLPAYYQSTQKEEWREATAHLESHATGDDVFVHATGPSRVSTREILGESPAAYYLPGREVTTLPFDADDVRLERATDDADRVLVVLSRGSNASRSGFVDRLSGRRERCGHRSYAKLEIYCFE